MSWPNWHLVWPCWVQAHCCYVRQCCLIGALLLDLSRGLASHILLLFFIVCTAIHNCSFLSSFSSQHLGGIEAIT